VGFTSEMRLNDAVAGAHEVFAGDCGHTFVPKPNASEARKVGLASRILMKFFGAARWLPKRGGTIKSALN
jgi:hypothetical protein